ncbi:hypothetical protein [Paenibacillus terrae]
MVRTASAARAGVVLARVRRTSGTAWLASIQGDRSGRGDKPGGGEAG